MPGGINAVFTIDENYIPHFCTAACSLLENNSDIIERVYLAADFDAGLPAAVKAAGFLEDTYAREVKFLRLDSAPFKRFRITQHVSAATYFRVLLGELLPGTLERVLFLDSDLVVNGRIDPLLEADFRKPGGGEYSIYAADHRFGPGELARFGQLCPGGLEKYFNAGVMLINLAKWRRTGFSQKAIKFIEEHRDELLFWDQDALNCLLRGDWGLMSPEFNCIEPPAGGCAACPGEGEGRPVIIHYIRSEKPWHLRSRHPCRGVYLGYRRKTPFWPFIPEDAFSAAFLKSLVPAGIKSGLKKLAGDHGRKRR